MPVLYDGKSIIPAPMAEISKEFNTQDDGKIIGSTYRITLTGKLTVDRGSPNSSGTFWTSSGYPPDETIAADSALTSMLAKQKAMFNLFSTEGKTLEIAPYDGSTPKKFNPRIKSVQFSPTPNNWTTTVDYTIQLEADGEDFTSNYISKANEQWNIEAADDIGRTYRVTHSCTAIGKRHYDETGTLTAQAWENAKTYVLNTIGLGIEPDRLSAPGVLDATSLQAFNYFRAQNLDELSGQFGVTETWLGFDPQGGAKAIEDFTVETRTSNDDGGKSRVSISGTIKGLEVRDTTSFALSSTRYTNAIAKWNEINSSLLTRAQNISGITLNSIALSQQYGINQINGTVTYTYEYDNRAALNVSGALSEVITISNDNPADIFAIIPILGRPYGPILQTISTFSQRKKSISIEAVMPSNKQGYTATEPNTDSLVLSLKPIGTYVYLESDRDSWSAQTGRYSRQTTYVWES